MRIITERTPVRPLDSVAINKPANAASLRVLDGEGREYVRRESTGRTVTFRASGALGRHVVLALDEDGRLLETAGLPVDCETEIDDGGRWSELFRTLYWNIHKGSEAKIVRYRDRPWFLFSDWVRDHVHILKGKKYFFPEIKDAIELFGSTQQEDGMLYDYIMPHNPRAKGTENRFHDTRFIDIVENGEWYFERVPVEADVEYLWVEGLYYTWKATGETAWMKQWLPSAEKALRYDLESPLRWSRKYDLIKRGYTIDTWDFQTDVDSAAAGGDTMEVLPGVTEFGIMHGDNTGFAAACRYLAEMLEADERPAEAAEWRRTGRGILRRLKEVSWRDGYFRHWVPESEGLKRESDDREERQVSLSNTHALNRGIEPDMARGILGTYQRIRDERPESAPAEFYSIYPAFQEAFEHHLLPWHYVNGGQFGFIAGELARGAFRHGHEDYGVEVLRRLQGMLEDEHGEFSYYWLGKIEPEPERTMETLDISGQANADFYGENDLDGVPAWTEQGRENDLSCIDTGRIERHGVPLDVIDPAENGRRACIGLGTGRGYLPEAAVTVGRKAGCIYLHHCTAGSGQPVGWVTLQYADGTERRVYVQYGKHVKNWWGPTDVPYNRREGWVTRVAWAGQNESTHVGTYLWGLNNPEPEKVIEQVRFTHSGAGHHWFVLGLTLSDAPRYFKPPAAHGSWLVNWNSAGVVYALIEGLAGIVDEGLAYDRVRLSPRWAAAGVRRATACAKYAASDAYVRYRYTRRDDGLKLELAGNGETARLEILLPDDMRPARVTLDGEEADYDLETVDGSRYLCLDAPGLSARTVVIEGA